MLQDQRILPQQLYQKIMAQYNIQDLPDDDSLSESRSQIIRAPLLPPQVVNAQQYPIYVPQIVQPQIQANTPQPGPPLQQGPPPQQTQYYIQQLPQPPVQPQQVQHQQVVVQLDQNVNQPLIINPPPLVLRHTFISEAGLSEQKYFHIFGLCVFGLLNLCAILLMAISTSDPEYFCEVTYDIYDNRFRTSYYFIVLAFIYTTLITLLNHSKKMTKNHMYILRAIWNLSYTFVLFGAFTSSYGIRQYSKNYYVYRSNFGDELLYSVILLVVQIASILAALKFEKQITYEKFSLYIIPSASLVELLLYNQTNLQHQFYWISFFSALAFGYYLVFLIQKINKSGLFNQKTNQTSFCYILWFIYMVFPFYESKK